MVKRKLPASEVLAAEYNSGLTEEQIAQKYSATKQAVSLRLRKLGITRPAGRPEDTDEQKRIKELEKEVALLKSVLNDAYPVNFSVSLCSKPKPTLKTLFIES